jgi:chaperonin GroES
MDIQIPIEEILKADNIADLLDEQQLKYIGNKVIHWYTTDEESRSGWLEKNKAAMNLAMQVVETKSYPWPNASNVKFPLLTIAALQFSARVYPALIKAPDLVKYRIVGRDPQGQKASRAYRVGKYMSYQLLDEDEHWEEEQDKLMIALPIMGCMFKKTMYDPMIEKCRSRIVFPKNLAVHYYAKDLERSRATEIFELYPSEIVERQLKKIYIEYDVVNGDTSSKERNEDSDQRQGLSAPIGDDQVPRDMLESHCFWDLDGDGVNEPYTITVDKTLGLAVRIKTRFRKIISQQSIQADRLQKQAFLLAQSIPPLPLVQRMPPEQQRMALQKIQQIEQQVMQLKSMKEQLLAQPPNIIRIEPKVHYTKYSFIPAPDGGFYDLGFGQLLGPINMSVDTLINQLIDSGTLQQGSQGFIGKGARIQGGRVRFEPYEWKRVAVAGATLKDSLVPLPVNAPSPVLFQLLGLLIQYAERIGSVTDVMSGENPGQNTPAYNMSAMLEQGLQVFNGVFKRIYRSFRSELRKVYICNSEYLDPETYFETLDGEFKVLQNDFLGDPKDLMPAADPNAFSNMEALTKAAALKQAAMSTPGYNPIAVEQRWLEAMDIPDVQEVFPITPDGKYVFPPQPNPELELEKTDLQRKAIEGKIRGEVDAAIAEADIMLKEAQAMKAQAEAQQVGQGDASDKLKVIQEMMKMKREEMKGKIDAMIKLLELQIKREELEIKREEAALDMEVKEHEVENQKEMSDDKVDTQKKLGDQKVESAKQQAKVKKENGAKDSSKK